MAQALKDTINSDRQDSPVFLMLPKLEAQNPERFLPVPNDFGEEVEIAKASGQIGKLSLLAYEAEGFPWQIPALRAVGDVQFYLQAFEAARDTWEKIRKRYADDLDANDRLATIYQRLAEGTMENDLVKSMEWFAKSDLSIERLLKNAEKLSRTKRAETYSLKARNAKSKWLAAWKGAPVAEQCQKAFQSGFLKEAFENYACGFYQDLNHYYSGINAVGMLSILIDLAERHPIIFGFDYDSEDEAKLALTKLRQKRQQLATVVQTAIDSEKSRLKDIAKKDPWLAFTEADLACIVSNEPERVAMLYRRAIQGAGELNMGAAKRQLQIYQQLTVLPENVEAALREFGETAEAEKETATHFILFTGHMIDKDGREEPRFPADKEQEARAAIKAALQLEKESLKGAIKGIAGGACGGDILFHEVCEELNIPTVLFLALPREQFIKASVQFAGPQWVKRFDRLVENLPDQTLAETAELPRWLQKKPNYSIWVRNNLWMLESALTNGGANMTLVALWDGKGGDGAGGTEHMVKEARNKGARIIWIDTKTLFGYKSAETVGSP